MKYIVVLYDGMADYPVPALGGKTPMMCAKTKFGKTAEMKSSSQVPMNEVMSCGHK